MEYIYYALKISMGLLVFFEIIKIFMVVANYVGEQLGVGKFFIYL